MSKQIGWSNESNLLADLIKNIKQLISLMTTLRQFSGYNGTQYINHGAEVECAIIGFESWEDGAVISSIKDENGDEQVVNTGWDGVNINDGKTIWFGFTTSAITLSSGFGQGIKVRQ